MTQAAVADRATMVARELSLSPAAVSGTPDPPSGHTTCFSRHGFSSWRANILRIVSLPALATIFLRVASSAISSAVHRERPGGGGAQTIATIAASVRVSRSRGDVGRASSPRASASPPFRKRHP
ncbi:MAG TPA: hypothetical protein VFK85_13470 [Anaeromyxobacteraceae bacterium]|nr:hypothetical protein [Anaeromyxobacteraceae bacterium]